MLFFVVSSLVSLKAYQQYATAGSPTTLASEQTASAAAASTSGVAPTNGMPASPSPVVASSVTLPVGATADDDMDDGAMTATVAATTMSDQAEPVVMSDQVAYDTNETQSTSGQDTPVSQAYRRQGAPRNVRNTTMDAIWRDVCDTDYISSQPGIQHAFHAPGVQRQDWNPALNNQPWARNTTFQNRNDATSQFDTDSDGVPTISNSTEDDV